MKRAKPIQHSYKLFASAAAYLKKQDAVKVGIFGSYARGEATAKSDLDILVKFSPRKSLMEMVRIERELSQLIGVRVDLLTEAAISPHIRPRIKKQLRMIHG